MVSGWSLLQELSPGAQVTFWVQSCNCIGRIHVERSGERGPIPSRARVAGEATGDYPVALPSAGRLSKHVFEQLPMDLVKTHVEGVALPSAGRLSKHVFEQLPMDLVKTDVEGVALGVPGGAGSALRHP